MRDIPSDAMEDQWEIAGATVATDGRIRLPAWAGFAVTDPASPPLCRIEIADRSALYGLACLYARHAVRHILRDGEDLLLCDEGFDRMTLCGDADTAEGLLLAGVSARLCRACVVMVHGALVEAPMVGGVLFLGASGAGKSTQGVLWEALRGARVLNGDRVFLRMQEADGQAVGYGSPFGGSSPWRVNAHAPLSLLVLLARGEECIRPLSDEERMGALFRFAFLPTWDRETGECTARAVETLTRIAARTRGVALFVPTGYPDVGVETLARWLAEEGVFCGSVG